MNKWLSRFVAVVVAALVVCGIVPPIHRDVEEAVAAPRKRIKVNRRVVGSAPKHAFKGKVQRSPEITSMRTRTSRTFQNDFGAFETEVFTTSIHYEQNGEWRPIDNTFEDAPGGYRNRANEYAAQLPRVLGAAPVRFGVGAEFVSLDLEGAAPVQGEATENRVTYAEALPGVDVVYEALADQLKDSMMLQSPEAQSAFAWRLQHSPALTATATPSGGVDFRNATGEIVTSIAPPLIHDAKGATEGAAPQHSFTLERGEGFHTLRLRVDEQWLAAPEREFPVTVDPTLVINAQKDCYIADGTLANNTFCGTAKLQVGRSNDGYRNRSLLRFDVGQFPNNAEVLNAHMGLYLTSATTSSTPAIQVRPLAKNFVDGWVTWQSSGAGAWDSPGGDFKANEGYVKKDFNLFQGWNRFYITRLVKDWIAKGVSQNHGVIVKLEDESVTQLLDFSALESSTASKDTRPILSVTWDHGGMGDLPTYKVEQERLTERRERRVNVAGGNLLIHETDFKVPGIGLDLEFERYYNSLIQAENIPTQTPLGTGWSLSVGGDIGLKLFRDSDTVSIPGKESNEPVRGAAFFGPSGYRLPFVKESSDGEFLRPPGLNATLKRDATTGNYVLTFRATEERYVFSLEGTLLEHKDKNENKISFFYNASNKVSSIRDTAGRTVTFTYNAQGRLATVEDPALRKHQYGYDPQDNSLLRTYTDPSGAVTTYEYDQFKRLKSITDAEGHQTLYEYNDRNFVTKITEITNTNVIPPTGDVTTFTYTTSDGTRCPIRQGSHSLADMPLATEVRDARGFVTTYCYNELSRVRLVKDAKNQKTYLSYNADANITSYIDARDKEFAFSYDQTSGAKNGNLIAATSFNSGSSQPKATNIEYDNEHPGFPSLVTDSQGNQTKYEYDSRGNLTRVIQGFHLANSDDRIVFKYHYDSRGLVTWIEKPAPEPDPSNYYGVEQQGNDVGFTYNANGDLTNINYPQFVHGYSHTVDDRFGDMSYTYDALGRVTGIYDGENMEHSISYDLLDRITNIRFDKWSGYNTLAFSYAYDKVGNLVRREQSLGGGSPAVSTFTYDIKNQPKSETHTGAQETTYGFDAVGNLTSLTKADIGTTKYGYNEVNLLDRLEEVDGAVTTFGYNSVHKRTSTTFPNGVKVTTTYNHARDVETIEAKKTSTGEILANLRYDYVQQGTDGSKKDRALLQKVEDLRTNETTSYAYDAFNRLKSADTTNAAGTRIERYDYEYDKNSNITSVRTRKPAQNVDSTEWSFYGDVSEIMCVNASSTCPYGQGKRYYHDGRGGVRSSSVGLGFSYYSPYHTRAAQRTSNTQYEFAYRDATQEQRSSKTKYDFYWPNYWVVSGTEIYEHDLLGWERDRISPETITYLRDSEGTQLGQKVTSTSGAQPQKRYYVADRLGSVVAITNGSGDVTKRYSYDPYGKMTATGSDTIHQPWRYAGAYYDKDLDIYQMGARFYEPNLRQFTQMDPMLGEVQDPKTLNPYVYAQSDPINNFDPTGADSCSLAEGTAALLGGAGGAAVAAAGLFVVGSGGIGAFLAGLTLEVVGLGTLGFMGQYVDAGCPDT